MTTTARQREPRFVDPDERASTVEVLIPEARARARRRRRWSAAAVLVACGLVLVGFIGRDAQPPEASSASSNPADSTSAAAVQGPPRVLAANGLLHVGFVIVYDDGAVIGSHDGTDLLQRRLTDTGLDMVRSGALQPTDLMFTVSTPSRALWAEREFRPYLPERYAACSEGPGVDAAAPARSQFPASVQTLLSGKERVYLDVDLVSRPHSGPIPPVVACAEVTAAEAAVLVRSLDAAGFRDFDRFGSEAMRCGGMGPPRQVWMCVNAVLPHGSWVLWGG